MCIGFDLSLNDLDAVVYHTYRYLVILAFVKLGDLREGSSLKFGDLRDEIILYLNIFNTGFKIFLFLQRYKVNQTNEG